MQVLLTRQHVVMSRQYIICTCVQGSSCHALIWLNLMANLEFWVRRGNMYCHFTLMNKLNVKHNGNIWNASRLCWMFYVMARIYVWERRVFVVLWTFHVGWFSNRIDFLALSVTIRLYSYTVLLVLLLLLHYIFRPTACLTSGGMQYVQSLSGPSDVHIVLLVFLCN